MSSKNIIKIEEKVPLKWLIPLSLQHTFAMFGASVLVPILFGIDAGIVLFMNGVGTLLFVFITKGKAPAYLGSSFAFLGPALQIINSENYGYSYALGGFFLVGLIGCILAYVINRFGTSFIDIILPPAAMGSVVSLIGFELATLTIGGGKIGADLTTFEGRVVFGVTLVTAILGSVLFRKFFSTISILISMIVGYLIAVYLGMVDFVPILSSKIITVPHFTIVNFALKPMLTIVPVILVIISEHISHQVVTSNIVGKDLLKEPGLHKTLFADNFSTMLSALVGGVPTTTYGENIGVMAITKVYSVYVIAGAAVISIMMAFIGPFSALINTIPGSVIGGVTFLLYGMIGVSGLRLFVEKNVDFNKTQNLILTSVIFVTGLSGLSVNISSISLKGMNLASVVAIAISLLFYLFDKYQLLNE